MRALTVNSVILLLLACPVQSETLSCEGSNVTVTASSVQDIQLTCDAVARADVLFEGCNIPTIMRPVRIELITALTDNCLGVYHCGDDWIELLAPSAIAARRSPDSVHAYLSSNEFFQSIAVHELAHAAIENMPCPFEACIVGNEYVANAMQIMSLTPTQQHRFTAHADADRPIPRDELSADIYYMAPDVFAKKAWMHFTQRDDPCGFIGQIVNGTVLLDRERFE